jgi:tRNA(Ile)-lysidine synthase
MRPDQSPDMSIMARLQARVAAFCRAHGLFASSPVVVAVSGGADSLVLLHILHTLRAELGVHLHVASFDHGMRGAAGRADAEFVREYAAGLGLAATIDGADVPALARAWTVGPEAAARRARYAFLGRVAAEVAPSGAARVALGHQRDDQAETVLLHLVRGTGLAGLRGMPPVQTLRLPDDGPDAAPLTLVRPLLEVTRDEVEVYARAAGIEPRHDATNDDVDYARNRIRHVVMPALAALNADVAGALARLAATARDDYAALTAGLPFQPTRDAHSGMVTLAAAAFAALAPAHQRLYLRLARAHLAGETDDLTLAQVEGARMVIGQAHSGGAWADLGGGVGVYVVSGLMYIYHADPVQAGQPPFPRGCPYLAPGGEVIIDGAGTYALPGSDWALAVTVQPAPGQAAHDPLTFFAMVAPDAQMRLRSPALGDRFRPAGMDGHSQKLSDTLTNMKVLSLWRARLPLLVIDGNIRWFVAPTGAGGDFAPRARVGHSSDTPSSGGYQFHFFRISAKVD